MNTLSFRGGDDRRRFVDLVLFALFGVFSRESQKKAGKKRFWTLKKKTLFDLRTLPTIHKSHVSSNSVSFFFAVFQVFGIGVS